MSTGMRVALVGMAVATATLLAGCAGGTTAPPAPGPSLATVQSGYEQVIRDVLPSVVQITSGSGLGSGVVYDNNGHIVTNAHVVGTGRRFQVTFATGATPSTATLVASYPPEDLAVIKVDGAVPVKPATFGDSSNLAAGQLVLAMGNPLGLSSSVSDGIISAVGRTVTEPPSEASPGSVISDMIQTSAAINPGNSGGALVDMSRNVIGIPTLAAADQQLGGAAPGIGFAIASNTVKRIADQIVADGRVTNSGRAIIGIAARTVIDANNQPAGVGVVQVLPGSGAQRAGLRPGDIITRINNADTPTIVALNKALAALKPGDRATIALIRGGTPQTVMITLGEQ